MIPRVLNPEETVRFTCADCRKAWSVDVRHYDRIRCACGKTYWALRPIRSGPLVMNPWPGTPDMLSYAQKQENLTTRANHPQINEPINQ